MTSVFSASANVSIVSSLPFVEQVLAEPGYEGVQIWTVIDSEPFDTEPRYQIYDAELEASQVGSRPLVLFRLVDRREYGEENLSYVLPDNGHRAWCRASQA